MDHAYPVGIAYIAYMFVCFSMELLGILGCQYRHGAGVLDIQYESSDIVYSCGYDTFIRMWDLRTPFDTWSVFSVMPCHDPGQYSDIVDPAIHGSITM